MPAQSPRSKYERIPSVMLPIDVKDRCAAQSIGRF